MEEQVIYETDGQIAVARINRPEARNALNNAVRQGLWDAFNHFKDAPELRVFILTATGDKAFSSGHDLKELNADNDYGVPYPLLRDNLHIDKPVIAAVNGMAFGGGLRLSMMCDLCVASDNATFGATEPRWGRGTPWAAPLARMIPPRIAMEMVMTAKPLTAQRAYELGLVNAVCPLDDLLSTATALAESIVANAPLSVNAGKEVMWWAIEDDEHQAYADGLFEPVYASQDAIEGPLAFREKRPPVWQGR
jgi:enoyl-CoA hydratase/carnithine racemase